MKTLWKRLSARTAADMKRLHGDESGALMILMIAAILLLVAMVYAIISTGQRVVQKELIQSSADTAAFSAAVIKAKGLNLIAFCNLIMALLLAIIMLLRLIKGALGFALGLCIASCFAAAVSFGFGGALCPFVGVVEPAYNTYSNLVAQVEPRIMDVMRGVAQVERGVAKAFPALSLVEAYRVGTHSHYQRNFSGGVLVTVAFPLPIGKDLSLPVQDGTWDQLCDQATASIGRLTKAAVDATGLPPIVGDLIGQGVSKLIGLVQGVLCGSENGPSTTNVSTYEKRYTCEECDGAEKANLIGDKIIKNSSGDVIGAEPGQTCQLDGFNAWLCGSGATVTCADGNDYTNLTLTECLVKKNLAVDVGQSIQNKPKPLVLSDDWRSRAIVRAYTILTSSSMDARRRPVALATSHKGTSNPALNQLLATAQAEVYAHNRHEDLWHMNWRARLVRFSFTNEASGGTGSAGSDGPPASGVDKIVEALGNFLKNEVGGALADQFLLH